MKNLFRILFISVASVAILASCEPVQNSFTQEAYFSDIYTVNKHTLQPEFEDTLYRIKNFDSFADTLKTGDRAHILVHYFYDAYSGRGAEWNIVRVIEKIPTDTLAARDVNETDFNLPLSGIMEYELLSKYLYPAWVRNNRLNVNVLLKAVPDSTDFAMTVREVKSDTVSMNLYANTSKATTTKVSKLLTFDLKNIADMFTETEKSNLAKYENLKFRVHFRYRDDKDSLFNYRSPVITGNMANPLRK